MKRERKKGWAKERKKETKQNKTTGDRKKAFGHNEQ